MGSDSFEGKLFGVRYTLKRIPEKGGIGGASILSLALLLIDLLTPPSAKNHANYPKFTHCALSGVVLNSLTTTAYYQVDQLLFKLFQAGLIITGNYLLSPSLTRAALPDIWRGSTTL